MTASEIIKKYIEFFEERGHARIANSSLVPLNDPTTLFTSSGMQPLVPYLLGEQHPQGKRLVNVQNCFRAQDIDEIGDNRHTTFFRMLGNWSLGDYFKKDQIPWFFEFLTEKLNIPAEKLYVTVFEGDENFKVHTKNDKFEPLRPDVESVNLWTNLFKDAGLNPEERIFYYGPKKNWWSRSGTPDKMPAGEPGGPDSEVFYEFDVPHDTKFGKNCHVNCDCGKYLEIGNSVFMQYLKREEGFEELPQKNVDFGGGLERLVMATENTNDAFSTSLLAPIIETIENTTAKEYGSTMREMRIIADHLIAGVFITSNEVRPSNKEQGYILRRLLRRAFDNFYALNGDTIVPIIEKIVDQYKESDEILVEKFEEIKNVILEEEGKYRNTLDEARRFISKRYPHPNPLPKGEGDQGDELFGVREISADDAFLLYTTHGLSPTQIKSLGFEFDHQKFAEKMEEHQKLSRAGAAHKFAGGLADHEELTVKGHTATHLLQQALRDVLGDSVHQTGSNITTERLRFDFNFDRKLTEKEIKKVEEIVLAKISDNLPVHYELLPIEEAKKRGALGLFDEKYGKDVKVYFIGGSNPSNPHPSSSPKGRGGEEQDKESDKAYSMEFCGGPHVEFTGNIKSFRIIKEESLGKDNQRIYAKVE